MSAPSSTADPRAAGRLAEVGLGLCAGFALLVLIVHGIAMIAWPYQSDYGEGVVLSLTDAWLRGDTLYRDPSVYPWRATPYAPLYVAVCAALSRVSGVTLAAGRLVSWLAALGVTACLIGAASRRARASRRAVAAVAAAAFFLCCPLTVGWAALYRVDFLALFFEVLGLLVVDAGLRRAERGEGGDTRLLAVAGPVFALAFFTKQSYLLGLAAACLVLARRRPSVGLAFAAWSAACIALPFAWLEQGLGGGHLFSSLFTQNVMPWSWDRAWPWVSQYVLAVLLLLALALLGVRGDAFGTARPWLWWAYLVLATATLVGVGRIGAYYNHFLPFHAALSVSAALALSSAIGTPRASVALGLGLLQAVGVGLFLPLQPTLPSLAVLTEEVRRAADGRLRQRIAAAAEGVQADIATLARYPGDVVAENMALPVQAGRAPVLCDPSTLFAMAESGTWAEDAFVEAVRARRFGVIVLQRVGADNARFSPAALEAVGACYVEAGIVGGDHLLVPRAAPR